MATEQASTVTTESGSLGKWASWLAAVVGVWVIVSPFVLSGSITTGTAMWSNVVAGVVITVLAAYGAYSIRSAVDPGANALGEWSGWITGLVGIWIIVSPFVLSGSIAAGPVMWSNVAAGLVAVVLAAYAGYSFHSA